MSARFALIGQNNPPLGWHIHDRLIDNQLKALCGVELSWQHRVYSAKLGGGAPVCDTCVHIMDGESDRVGATS